MKILVWNQPWPSQGSLLFFRNCFIKHLVIQANTLSSIGCGVDVVIPEAFKTDANLLDPKIKQIHISLKDVMSVQGVMSDPAMYHYAGSTSQGYSGIAKLLHGELASAYDVILLWETPAPFLEELFPDAVVVHQMPGAFSRPPYPHSVIFDPVGLYKRGALHRFADQIASAAPQKSQIGLVERFNSLVKGSIQEAQPFRLDAVLNGQNFSSLTLLPLQVTQHYSFRADCKYTSQLEFLIAVAEKTHPDTGLLVTQYISNHTSDTPINPAVLSILKGQWPNILHREEFDHISSVSQYLLPFVDRIVSCSSSIVLQAMAWGRDIDIVQSTFLSSYSTKSLVDLTGDKFTAYRNVLNFILTRHQPRAELILSDGSFLSAILEDMIARKKAGNQGINLLPDFTQIRSNYGDTLCESFNVSRAIKSVKTINYRVAAELDELAKFKRAVQQPGLRFISFDIFDTLVNRPVETPSDVYALLEVEALRTTYGGAEDFARVRVTAELAAREDKPAGEISLLQIYERITEHYGLTLSERDQLMALEIDVESRLISARPFGKRMWEVAVNTGKPIVLVSDMYHAPEIVENFVRNAGYEGYQRLFVSSEFDSRKKDGSLFDVVVSQLGVSPDSILHIGDNKLADIEQAKAKGLRPFRILRAIDRMRGNELYKSIFDPRVGAGEKSRSIIAGAIASRLFDTSSGPNESTSLFAGSPYRLGYAAIGPLLTGYMLWLGRRAKFDKISKLYFLAREGKLLHDVYQALHPEQANAIPSAYLYSSRRAVRVAGIKTESDIPGVASMPFENGALLGRLLKDRFGLLETDIPADILAQTKFTSLDTPLSVDTKERIAFGNLCGLLRIQILARAAKERTPYITYLAAQGLGKEGTPAVVDIGWKANMQGALGSLLGKPLAGYYYATMQGAERWILDGHRVSGYAGESLIQGYGSALLKNRHLIEFLTCNSDRSLERMIQDGPHFVPVFRNETKHGARKAFIDEVHRGALDFARDLRDRLGHLLIHIHIDPSTAERVLDRFITAPTADDAELLKGLGFEDSFGGVEWQYLVSPTDRNKSVWKQGFDALCTRPEPKTAGIMAVARKVKNVYQPQTTNVKSIVASSLTSLAPTLGEPEKSNIIIKLEKIFVKAFSSERKYHKYLRNRKDFFTDSKAPIMQRWYSMTR
jgi:HAD superfamily hydrolase (TIGR01549 family)